jgi:superfamily II DNA or RNA helicase
MSLIEALQEAEPTYVLPDEKYIPKVLIPAMSNSETIKIQSGYFSSSCFKQIAPGLASFISSSNSTMQLLLAVEGITNPKDHEAIETGLKTEQELIENLFHVFVDSDDLESAITKHARDCLSFLVASNRLEIKFVLMGEPSGQFHPKSWIFHDETNLLVINGSGNASTRGLVANGEVMTLHPQWEGDYLFKGAKRIIKSFNEHWEDRNPESKTYTPSPEFIQFLSQKAPENPPTEGDMFASWDQDFRSGLEKHAAPTVHKHRLRIPRELNYKEGPYKHQGVAIDNFFEAGNRGLLGIATGGGKTKTALITATLLQDSSKESSLLILILVPKNILATQWEDEVKYFGITPINVSALSVPRRKNELQKLKLSLSSNNPSTRVIITTQQLYNSDENLRNFTTGKLSTSLRRMIIGDEAHGLGTPGFLNHAPHNFKIRMGLSATPVRQYDTDGTAQLIEYFGEEVFQFGLKEAIESRCLVPYNYHIHKAYLNDDEIEYYEEVNDKISRIWRGEEEEENEALQRLLEERSAILENCQDKIPRLRSLIQQKGSENIQRTLFYASSKHLKEASGYFEKRQIDLINKLLREEGVGFHQLTSDETGSIRSRNDILRRFSNNELAALTAMKVLDEGVDIPQTDTAYFLGSSKSQREWIQRRGRVLRKAPGKEMADIHDFIAIPHDPKSTAGRLILGTELERIMAFNNDCQNSYAPGGPDEVRQEIEDSME